MTLKTKFLMVALLIIFLPPSKGFAEKRSSIGLEILGKPISAIKKTYPCTPTMIAGPSKGKIICANSSEKLIVATEHNKVVSVRVIQLTTETSVNNVLIGHSENCRKSMESDFKLELFCEEQKTIKLRLDINASELKTEFCFLRHCGTEKY